MNKKKYKFLRKCLIGVATLGSFAIVPSFSVKNNQSELSVSSSVKYGSKVSTYASSQSTKAYSARFSIKTLADAKTQLEMENIQGIYSNQQSNVAVSYGSYETSNLPNVNALPGNSLYNLFEFTDAVTPLTGDVSTRPKIEILSKADSGKGETATTPLSNFKSTNDLTISQNYLNSIGVMFIKVTTYNKASTNLTYTDYVMLTGFGSGLAANSQSGVLTPSGEEFKKKVPELSNSDLASFPEFISNFIPATNTQLQAQTNPTLKQVLNRQNNARAGSVKYDMNFD